MKGFMSILGILAFSLFAWRVPVQALTVQEEPQEEVTACDKTPQVLERLGLSLDDLETLRSEAAALEIPLGRYLIAYLASEADDELSLEDALAMSPGTLMRQHNNGSERSENALMRQNAAQEWMQQARQMRQNKDTRSSE